MGSKPISSISKTNWWMKTFKNTRYRKTNHFVLYALIMEEPRLSSKRISRNGHKKIKADRRLPKSASFNLSLKINKK